MRASRFPSRNVSRVADAHLSRCARRVALTRAHTPTLVVTEERDSACFTRLPTAQAPSKIASGGVTVYTPCCACRAAHLAQTVLAPVAVSCFQKACVSLITAMASTDSASANIASSVAVVVYSADVSASLLDLCTRLAAGAGRTGNDAIRANRSHELETPHKMNKMGSVRDFWAHAQLAV